MPHESVRPLFVRIDCLRLPVRDLDAALAFYRDRLGHELIWRTDAAAGLRLPDSNAELVLQTERPQVETDLAVESVDEPLDCGPCRARSSRAVRYSDRQVRRGRRSVWQRARDVGREQGAVAHGR